MLLPVFININIPELYEVSLYGQNSIKEYKEAIKEFISHIYLLWIIKRWFFTIRLCYGYEFNNDNLDIIKNVDKSTILKYIIIVDKSTILILKREDIVWKKFYNSKFYYISLDFKPRYMLHD